MTHFDTILTLLNGAEFVHFVADENGPSDVFLAWYGGDSVSVFQWQCHLSRARKVHSIMLPSGFAKCPLAVVKMNAEIWGKGLLTALEDDLTLDGAIKRMTHSHTA